MKNFNAIDSLCLWRIQTEMGYASSKGHLVLSLFPLSIQLQAKVHGVSKSLNRQSSQQLQLLLLLFWTWGNEDMFI